MQSTIIESLDISNVSQMMHPNEELIYIYFEIDTYLYELTVSKQKSQKWQPNQVLHETKKREKCKICEKEWMVCKRLENYKYELFHRLIQFHSIRLYWIYLDY